jgi:hypothetical protein
MWPPGDRQRGLLIVPAVFCLLGLGMLAPALWLGYGSWSFLQAAQSAQGTVIALEWSDDNQSSGARPVVRYEVRGEPYEITGSVWSSPPAYAVGDSVRVLYPAGQARAARIESWFDFWFLPTLLGGMGLLFGGIGGGLWYLLARSLRLE